LLAGRTIHVATNAAAARVTLRWKDGDQVQKTVYESGYALRLEFGALENGRLAGKIYFCAPDELKSYINGSFNAEIRRPRPKK
jgi:hypothetical protein